MAEILSILKVAASNAMLFGLAMVAFGKCLLVSALVLPTMFFANRLPANQKHTIWFLAIVILFAIPFFWLIIPPVEINVAVPEETSFKLLATPFISRDQYIEQIVLSHELDLRYVLFSTHGISIHGLPWTLIVSLIWASGIFLFLLRLIIGRIGVKRLIAKAKQRTRTRHQKLMQRLTEELNIKQTVDLKISTLCAIPFTYGLIRPEILIPSKMANWQNRRLEAVLRHELAHIKRNDCLTQFIARLVCALFWFIPLGWIAYRRLQAEQEKSCDVYVMGSEIRAYEYAGDIIDLVRGSGGALALPGLYSALVRKNIIKERIETILRFKRLPDTSKMSRKAIIPALFLCCMIPILALSLTTNPVISASDREIYGTWINQEYPGDPCIGSQKLVQKKSGAWFAFRYVNSTRPGVSGDRTFLYKWIDSEGNIYYKAKCEKIPIYGVDLVTHELHRVSSAGEVWEYISMPALLGWPTEIDPNDPEYRIYSRQK